MTTPERLPRRPGPPSRPRVWVVFLAYGLAVVSILVASLLAIAVLQAAEPDLQPAEIFDGMRGLLAGGLASSTALVFTFLIATRAVPAAALGLAPGRERGRDLAVVVAGVLSLGQALDSLTVLSGLADRGTMQSIRTALAGVSGIDLFAAVLIIGPVAGTAEEVFFRGYMQSTLRQRWPAWRTIALTSACFGLLHFDPVHTPLAFVLGLYLGFVRESTGSALPAVLAHVVNNVAFTVLTATVGSVTDIRTNTVLLVVTVVVFAACVTWLARLARQPPA